MTDNDQNQKIVNLKSLIENVGSKANTDPDRARFAQSLARRFEEEEISGEVTDFLVSNIGKLFVGYNELDPYDSEALNNKIAVTAQFDRDREGPLLAPQKTYLLTLYGQKN